jgi:hypothetical protein
MDNQLLSNRLKWAVAEKEKRELIEISNSDLSRIAKTSRASVTNWMKDINKMASPAARLLGGYLSVNPIWLETGKGEIRIKKVHPLDEYKSTYDLADDSVKFMIINFLKAVKQSQGEVDGESMEGKTA